MAVIHNGSSDFVLFPRDHTFADMSDSQREETPFHYYIGTDIQQPFPGLGSSTYDSYDPVSAYSMAHSSQYGGNHLAVGAAKETSNPAASQRYTPSTSPSTSMSQSFDPAPSILSSASGASVQSTASSAVGSPYSHPTQSLPSQETSYEPHHGLGIAPGVVQNDHYPQDIFSVPGMDNETSFPRDKFPSSFVGELSAVSSSSILASYGTISPVSSSSLSSSFAPAFDAAPLALDTSVGSVTIDSILEEVNNKAGTYDCLATPVSISSSNPSPTEGHARYLAKSNDQAGNKFKSPTAPASAMSPLDSGATSPSAARRPEQPLQTTSTSSAMRSQKSPPNPSRRMHPYGRPSPPPQSPSQAHAVQFQSPFFSQSSGRFVAPLQSSCWFSFCRPFFTPSFHSFLCFSEEKL